MLLLPLLPVLLCVGSVASSASQTCEETLKTCSVIACGRDGRDGPKGEKGEPGMKPCILAFYTTISSEGQFCIQRWGPRDLGRLGFHYAMFFSSLPPNQ